MIIREKRGLFEKYDSLRAGDAFIGSITGTSRKYLLLIDLLERDVKCFPSPLSQVLNGSKVAQAVILNKFMSPYTIAITRRHELMEAISRYNQHNIGAVITKTDKMHCGHGVRKWVTIETLYSYVSQSDGEFPFVLQPFLEDFTDVRVIIAGDYIEAYTRENPNNFRQNISSGGRSVPYKLNEKQKAFCVEVMARGKFPYAHIDLHIIDDTVCYLSEIALNGGIKGASIQRKELDERKRDLLECLASKI